MAVSINGVSGYKVKKKRENKHIATTILGVSLCAIMNETPTPLLISVVRWRAEKGDKRK